MSESRSEDGPPPKSHPLTVADVIEALSALVERDEKYARYAVHLLDMEPDPKGPETPWDGLCTHVETDALSHEQGWVVSLLAWRERDDGKSVSDWDHQPIPWPEAPAPSGRNEPE